MAGMGRKLTLAERLNKRPVSGFADPRLKGCHGRSRDIDVVKMYQSLHRVVSIRFGRKAYAPFSAPALLPVKH